MSLLTRLKSWEAIGDKLAAASFNSGSDSKLEDILTE